MNEKTRLFHDDIKRVFIQTVEDDKAAFILEANWMNELAGAGKKLLNKIASPGFKYGNIDKVEGFVKALFRSWGR